MTKVNVSEVLASVSKLYAKDKRTQDILGKGTRHKALKFCPLVEAHLLRKLGLPGLPYNKIVQVAGKPDSGKSTAALEAVVAAQKAGHIAVIWDSEDKFDAVRLDMMGGKSEEVVLISTNEILRGGELTRKIITAIKTQSPDAKILFIWDSIGGSQSRSHAERELDNEKHAQPGQDAKENALVMKMLVALFNKYPDSIAVYVANQIYAKIGFMQKGDATSGGNKLEFHSSFIVMLKRIKTLTKTLKGVKVKTGIVTRATVKKNHITAGDTSVYEMDFTVTNAGYQNLKGELDVEDTDNELDGDDE